MGQVKVRWTKLNWSYPCCVLAGMMLVMVARIIIDHFRTPPTPAPAAIPVKTATNVSWGVLKEQTLMLERPSEALRQVTPREIRWVFGSLSPTQYRELIQSSGLTAHQQKSLLDESHWQSTPAGIAVRPPLGLVRDMDKMPRQRLYDALAQTPENLAQRFPYVFRGEFQEWFTGCELSAARLSEVRAMIYKKGDVSVFADLPYFELTASSNEFHTLVRHVSRVPAMLASLALSRQSDLESLKRYWLLPGARMDFDPLLAALSRVQGGTTLNVVALLPPLPRTLAYSYPHPRDDFPPNADCLWTSMNFFNTRPDNRFVDEHFTGVALNTQYHLVPAADAFGDLIMLYKPEANGSMRMIHMCVHIADDIVFTKNGGDIYQPWVLMRLPDVEALFIDEPMMRTAIFRRNPPS